MTIQSVLAQSSVTDLSVAERWYSAAFGRGPDTRPMDGLIGWHLTEMSGGSGVGRCRESRAFHNRRW